MHENKLAILAADLFAARSYERKAILEGFGIHFKEPIADMLMDHNFCRALIYALNGRVVCKFNARRVFALKPKVPKEYEECIQRVAKTLSCLEFSSLMEQRVSLLEELKRIDRMLKANLA